MYTSKFKVLEELQRLKETVGLESKVVIPAYLIVDACEIIFESFKEIGELQNQINILKEQQERNKTI